MGPPFQVYIDARCLLKAAVVKKAGLWLCIHFCKDAWNKPVLARILCKKNCNLNSYETVLNIILCVLNEYG